MPERPDPFHATSALVTGAASGIGRALACALATRGARVHAADVDPRIDTLTAPTGAPGALTPLRLDVTDPTAVGAAVDAVVAEHGRIDHVFNNAGVLVAGRFEEMTDAAWERITDVNYWGVVHGTRHAYRVMLEQGAGHIVNTSSSAGVIPVPRMAAYTATKHAVIGLSMALRAEAAPRGVRVSAVVPGLVDTGIFEAADDVGGRGYVAKASSSPLGKVSAQVAAAAILRGVERNDALIVFPRYNRVLARLHRLSPALTGALVDR